MIHENHKPVLEYVCSECHFILEKYEHGHPGVIDVAGLGVYFHKIGDWHCVQGWCMGGDGVYPKRCVCGGLVHAEFDDEVVTEEGTEILLKAKCDQCGSIELA